MLSSIKLSLGLAVFLLTAWPTAAQTPSSAPAETSVAQQGYLLVGELHAEPDPSSDVTPTIGRDERVSVVPVDGKAGWHAVYRDGADQPIGYAFRPFVSRLGSADLAALQQPDGTQIPKRSPSEAGRDRLPAVVLAEGLSAEHGVLTRVEEWANVRVGPGVGTEAFGVLRPDVSFRVIAIERGWGKIKLQGDPEYGYVSGSLLHRVEETEEPVVADVEPDSGRSVLTISGASAGGSATLGDAEDGAEVEEVAGVEETTGIVYVTRTGHKYHRATCKHLRSVKFAMPLAEAMMDFAPCRTCRPPTQVPDDLPAP